MIDTNNNPNNRILRARLDTTMITARPDTLDAICLKNKTISYD